MYFGTQYGTQVRKGLEYVGGGGGGCGGDAVIVSRTFENVGKV